MPGASREGVAPRGAQRTAPSWIGLFVAALAGRDAIAARASDFQSPERVTILGYSDHAMEPFLTRDGRYLLFNNLNHPAVDTNLHYAERLDDTTFQYRGQLAGVNTPALEGVPTLDLAGTLYFVSPRSYPQTLSTIYRGAFAGGEVSGVELVPGVSLLSPGMVNFDVEVSPDGTTLYFVDSLFGPEGPQTADLVVARRTGSAFERLADTAMLMQSVNTAALEYAAAISADGLTLFFTRAGAGESGSPAIFVANRPTTSSPFGSPERIAAIDGFVEGPTLSPDELSLYYHRLDGPQFAIYRVTRSPAGIPALRTSGELVLLVALAAVGSLALRGARRTGRHRVRLPDRLTFSVQASSFALTLASGVPVLAIAASHRSDSWP